MVHRVFGNERLPEDFHGLLVGVKVQHVIQLVFMIEALNPIVIQIDKACHFIEIGIRTDDILCLSCC